MSSVHFLRSVLLASALSLGLFAQGCNQPVPTPESDAGAKCRTGELECGGVCVATSLDPAHCGRCDKVCAAGEVCSVGVCALQCSGGTTKCGDRCIDLKNDPAHCGTCDKACAAAEVCSAGICALQCTGGTTKCGDRCVDFQTDPAHCGTCDKVCAEGEVCAAGACSLACTGGTTKCGDRCIDLENDRAHCGTCDKVCAAGEVCTAFACALECTGGTTLCGDRCIDLKNDRAHCGTCDKVCAAGEVCTAGACALECTGGTTKCDDRCIDLENDRAHCGTCDKVCAAGEVCTAGACALECAGGTTLCDSRCVDLKNDRAHCGTCDKVCAAGEVCTAGACALECAGGTTKCDDRCVDTSADRTHCGSCDKVCAAGEVCTAGACVLECTGGTTECDGRCVDSGYDPSHCGACDHACGTSEVCSQGQCVPTAMCMIDSDCQGFTVARCMVAVCNHGAYPGLSNVCTVIAAAAGASCDDGLFCTTASTCDGAGSCLGAVDNDCGLPVPECQLAVCDEATDSCSLAPAADGGACDPSSLCEVNGKCAAGVCAGTPKVCVSAPGISCTSNTCNPATGACDPVPDGSACDDRDTCTAGETCQAGVCSGTATPGCSHYLVEGFETCPTSWTLTGDWQCGAPTNVGPTGARSGTNVVATQLAGNYSSSMAYASCNAELPALDLTAAVAPALSFWAYVDTEGSTYDGFNVKASTDGGSTWTVVAGVTPAYGLTIATEQAWGGRQSASGWQRFTADLTPFAGTTARLRLSFRSDSSGNYPGVYVDDVLVSERAQIPLEITTSSLSPAVVSEAYHATLQRTGGSASAVWSIVGGTNHSWLTIDPATGALGGTPAATGTTSVTVRVAEPSVPGNFAEKTLTLNVLTMAYKADFDGACPAGWTLTGDWQCGTPTAVGPAAAYSGTQCLGTQLSANYSNNVAWTAATATSPDIDLTSAVAPKLRFKAWVDTEGSSYDGFNLKISTDGGATYALLSAVTPAYGLTVGGESAWGGHLKTWQDYTADLSAYAGRTIRLRLAFRSDSSGAYPGVYVDDFAVSN
ncbi:MAG: MXAN_6577-like cysteine-rich protein [Myxococcales bacterium]